jgi:hypothetical protein
MRIVKAIVVLLAVSVMAAAASVAAGDWTGSIRLGEMDYRLALHVTESEKGLQATFDSIDQKVFGMTVEKIELKGQQLRFELASIQAVYTGTLNKAGTTITGEWSQVGMTFPVSFKKATQAKK